MSESEGEGMDSVDLFPGLDRHRAERALRELAEAAQEAWEFYVAENFDAAQMEVDRCRRAVRLLDGIRREQKHKSTPERP